MPAIAHVDLAVDNASNNATTPTAIGSASAALTNGAPTLVFAMGHASTTGGGGAHLDLQIGGVTVAAMAQIQNFGANHDIETAFSGQAQIKTCYLHTPASGSETMQFRGWCDDTGFVAHACRAYALDVSDIPENDGRWHEQTANSDTIVDVPTSGWEVVGNVLTVTAPRTGSYILIGACEAVGDTSGDFIDAVHVRLTQDGTPLPGSHHDAAMGPDPDGVIPWMATRIVSLTASTEYDFAVEANGTDSAGNHGYRRIRLHLIEVARIEDADVQQDLDTVGLNIPTSGTDDADILITLDPPASRDYLIIGGYQHQASWWSRGQFTVDGSTVDDGFACSLYDIGLGATNDLSRTTGMYVLSGVSTETDVGLRFELGPGATGAGGQANFGDACAHADAADITVIAIRLATASSDTIEEPASQRLRFQDGTPTLVQALTLAPASQRLRMQEGAPSLIRALTLSPSSERVRFSVGTAALVLGARTLAPASERLRIRDGAATLVAAYTLTPASERLRMRTGATSLVLGPVVLTPASQRLRIRTAALAAEEVVLGELSVSIRQPLFGATVREPFFAVRVRE